MGISFGDHANVHVEGSMIGEQNIHFDRAAQDVLLNDDLPLPHRREAVSAIQTIKSEMSKERPRENVVYMAASSLARSSPDIFKALISAVPAILQAVPAIQRLL